MVLTSLTVEDFLNHHMVLVPKPTFTTYPLHKIKKMRVPQTCLMHESWHCPIKDE